MTAEPLDELLARAAAGDGDAAEQMYRTYEPYLRKVVRRQLSGPLRAKFDSLDIVQSVWVEVLQGMRTATWSFPSANHLRAFLVTATRHRFIDRVRQNRHGLAARRLDSELDSELADQEPRPSQLAEASDLWERLLALCPPEQHELVRLRREGFSLDEIAARTGWHEGSIRRVFRTLGRRLAFE